MKNKINNTKEDFIHTNFETMGWHDCKIHAIHFDDLDFKLLFDIDYILAWNKIEDSDFYSFNITPATLVFKNVWDLKVNLEYDLKLRIEDIYKSNPRMTKNKIDNGALEYDWRIETTNGAISFKSIGFSQYLRGETISSDEQSLSIFKRGGISFKQG